MGTLRNQTTEQRRALGTRTLIGRSHRCDLQIALPMVSGEHALITWAGDGWTLRDLASRNGSWVNGRCVEAGVEVALAEGDTLGFGADTAGWTVASVSGPGPCALDLADGSVIEAPDGLLALPSLDAPEVLVSHSGSDGWLAERGAETFVVKDGREVLCAGRRFRLELPPPSEVADPMARTTDSSKGGGRFDMLALDFAVSRDEEYVELVAQLPERSVTLKPRAHSYTLLTLARLRLKDAEDDSLPESSHGWVHHDDLARMLALDPSVLNVQIFRARKQLAAAGFEDASRLVERRRGARQLRLGTGRIRVRSL